MVKRTDPARTGVTVGRVIGLLTATIAVISLLRTQGSYYEHMASIFTQVGVEPWLPIPILFWGNIVLTISARYVLGYVVGSLVGVIYDWLNRPSLLVLTGIVLVVGAIDGFLAAIDTRSIGIGCAYIIAWLCYVPMFVLMFDAEAENRDSPLRLGDT